MGIQDTDVSSSGTTITDYGVGGRGIDWMQISNASGSQVKYPVYDGHGNMVATLTKSGTGCSIGDARAYDAWGNILSGAGSGDPKGRYCANLGHKRDDESGLSGPGITRPRAGGLRARMSRWMGVTGSFTVMTTR